MQQHGFSLYLNGHSHYLTHYTVCQRPSTHNSTMPHCSFSLYTLTRALPRILDRAPNCILIRLLRKLRIFFSLSLSQVDKAGAYVTSGAGGYSMSTIANTETAKRLFGDDPHVASVRYEEGQQQPMGTFEEGEERFKPGYKSKATAAHTYQTIFNSKTAGFTQHTFSSDFSTLRTDFVSYQGAVLHSFTVNKQGVQV